jgi:hypothetical protein
MVWLAIPRGRTKKGRWGVAVAWVPSFVRSTGAQQRLPIQNNALMRAAAIRVLVLLRPMIARLSAARGVVPAAKRKYYTPPDSYHYSGFTNLWYTFEYHCQDGMGLTKGRLEVEQVE